MKKRFTEEQIIGFLREAEAGMPVSELCRRITSYNVCYTKLLRLESGEEKLRGAHGVLLKSSKGIILDGACSVLLFCVTASFVKEFS